ncbi:MAG: hypothetical protein ACK5O2_07800 [Microthrixaceae bacterium]
MLDSLGLVPTIAVLVVVMGAVVACSAALEQRGSTVHRVTTLRTEEPLRESAGEALPESVPSDDGPAGRPEPAGWSASQDSQQPASPVAQTRSYGLLLAVDGPEGPSVELGPLGVEADLTGVMFAFYVRAGLAESSRVTGWVTAAGSPPSIPTVELGDRLRGRATRIDELLECDDAQQNWVTLDTATDISLAISRRPPTDPVLDGLLSWWQLATGDRSSLPAEDVARLHEAFRAVFAAATANPMRDLLEEIYDLLSVAVDTGVGMNLTVRPIGVTSAAVAGPASNAGSGRPLPAMSGVS